MNLEEAIANIGKEVTYIGNDKELIDDVFKDKKLIISEPTKRMATNVLIEYDELCFWNIDPRHLKLKEQPMNYKIRVTPETSAEVQELFFALGGAWEIGGKGLYEKIYGYLYLKNKAILTGSGYDDDGEDEITLPQLRDLAVVKRNDVSDANYVQKNAKRNKFYVGHDCYYWNNDSWKKSTLGENSIKINLIPINKLNACFSWQDALRAVADGKEIQVWGIDDWVNTNQHYEWSLYHFSQRKFRIKPQTVTLEARPYTKEELLKIAGEME